jgi:hypothetical protein
MTDRVRKSKAMWIMVVAVICITLAISGWSQEKVKYEPTEIQSLRLKVDQQKALLAQRDLQQAQANMQAAMAALTEESAKIKKENGWPEDVTFNPDSLAFSSPAPTPAAAPAAPTAKK